jgi:hypothetical protein
MYFSLFKDEISFIGLLPEKRGIITFFKSSLTRFVSFFSLAIKVKSSFNVFQDFSLATLPTNLALLRAGSCKTK